MLFHQQGRRVSDQWEQLCISCIKDLQQLALQFASVQSTSIE